MRIILSIAILFSFLISCDKEEKKADPSVTSFDKKAMLSNIGNNIIIANYQVLKDAAYSLDTSITSFSSTTDSLHFTRVQNAFIKAYKAWQLCSVFEFGPAESQYLRVSLNIFPTDTATINSNINAGTYNLDAGSNASAKGFPAIDYLLFAKNNTLTKYTSDGKAANRRKYLSDLSAEIKNKVTATLNGWSASGGNYISTFSNSTGTDIGSSIGLLVNQLNFDLDQLKNAKMGIPLGKQTMGTLLPEQVEAYYSGITKDLLEQNLKTLENIFLGRYGSNDGPGLDDYLVSISAQYNGGSLSSAIKVQFAAAIAKVSSLASPLSVTIQNNTASVNAAYTEIQKLIVLLKTDMPSAMGVLITYVDNDGD